MKPTIYLSPPNLTGSEQPYLKQAFQENWIAPGGPLVQQFESKIAQYTGVNHCVALNSATSALHLAMLCFGVQKGDVVICPTFTFVASINPAVYCGATPVFVGVNADDWNISIDWLEVAIKSELKKGKTIKAIVVVHNYGLPAAMDKILALALFYNIKVVEDAAAAMGSTINEKSCGGFGDVGVVSFNGNKIITTSGGGVLLTDSLEISQEAQRLATQYKKQVAYVHEKVGYNYGLSNVLAAIGLGQMECLETFVTLKKQHFEYYQSQLEKYPIRFLKSTNKEVDWNHWMVCVLFENESVKKQVKEALLVAGIEVREVWYPMHLQPIYEESRYYGDAVAEDLYSRGLCLPSGTALTENEIDLIVNIIKQIF